MASYNGLHLTARNLFRLLHLCLSLSSLAWLAHRLLPFAGAFLRRLSSVISGHLFAFLLSNSIIAALFLTTALFSRDCCCDGGNAGEESEASCSKSVEVDLSPPPPLKSLLVDDYSAGNRNGNGNANDEEAEEGVFKHKKMMASSCGVNVKCNSDSVLEEEEEQRRAETAGKVRSVGNGNAEVEDVEEVVCKDKEMKRLNDAYYDLVSDSGSGTEKVRSEEEMSDEEFRRTVEDFIERHLKFRRLEFAQEIECSV